MPSKMPRFTRRARQAMVGALMLMVLGPWISPPAMARTNLMSMAVALKVENSCTVTDDDDGRVKCRCSDHSMPKIEQRRLGARIDTLSGPYVLLTVITW